MEPRPFPKQLASDRLKLEGLSSHHTLELWTGILEDRQHPKRNGIWPGIKSAKDLSAYVLSADVLDLKSEEKGYAIRLLDQTTIGTLHIFNLDWEQMSAEIGYSLHMKFTGQGFAIEAVKLGEEILKSMGFKSLKAQCQVWNKKSWQLAERRGFVLAQKFHKGSNCAGCDDCTRVYSKLL
jgi:RimJ/RimL family protein N-acetyltransferase